MLMSSRILAILLLCAALIPLMASADEPPPKKAPEQQPVTLSGTLEVSAALAALTKQTGIAVVDRRGESDAKITVDLKKATFWQALDQIADAANAQVDVYTSDGQLALKKRSGKPAFKDAQMVSYDGLFRTSIKRITPSIDLETGETTYHASLEVAWVPTLQPFYLETRPQNLVVKDDQMKELPPINLGNAKAQADGRNALLFDTLLPTLPRETKRIGHMEGKLSIVAPSRMLLFTFKESLAELYDKLNDKQKPTTPTMTLNNVECAISRITFAKEHWEVRVALKYPPGNTELGSYQSWVVNNELVLESKDSKTRFPATTYYLDPATATHAVVTYNFQNDPKQNRVLGKAEDWKLSYRTPETVVTIPISFSFKNVPLP
jgi:hypothetical protein